MLEQCWALVRLKWALHKNTWSTGKLVSTTVLIILGLLALLFALGLSISLFLLMRYGIDDTPLKLLLILDVILFFYSFAWLWGLLFELQRSDVIDFAKMLHLPMSLSAVFGLNYFASLFSPSLIFFLPASLAITLGLSLQFGGHMIFVLPLAAAFYAMMGAWAYYLRGVLAILMENKRRRRLILTLIPLCIVVLAQTPNLISNAMIDRKDGKHEARISKAQMESAVRYGNIAMPLGWLPLGVWALSQGKMATPLWCFSGLMGLAGLGLGLGYRSTLRHYTGAKQPKPERRKKKDRPQGTPLTTRRLPLCDEDTSAMTCAAFLTYLRHPNIRMLIVMPVFMGLLLLFMYHTGPYSELRGDQGAWLPLAVLVWPFFNFSFMIFNLFGIDQQGFRGMVLLPLPRYKYLLAKNAALFPFVGGLSIAFVLLGAVLLKSEPAGVALSLLQVPQLFLMFCIIGNLTSVYLPYAIGRDAMRSPGRRGIMFLMGLLSMALVGLLLLPSTLCLHLDDLLKSVYAYQGPPLALFAAILLLAFTGFAYTIALRHTGDLLLAREHRVLEKLLLDRD